MKVDQYHMNFSYENLFQTNLFWAVSVYLFSPCVCYYSQIALLALNEKTNGHEILLEVRPILENYLMKKWG